MNAFTRQRAPLIWRFVEESLGEAAFLTRSSTARWHSSILPIALGMSVRRWALLVALADETRRAGHRAAPLLVWASSDAAQRACAFLATR